MKQLLPIFTILLTLLLTACGDDPIPDPPERGLICVTPLDQNDEAINGCEFDYEVDETLFDEEVDHTERYGDPGTFIYKEDACTKDQLLVYGAPGEYKVRANCGKLSGTLEVDLDEGENEDYSSRLVGSFCTDELVFEATPSHKFVELQDYLGFSSANSCNNWLTKPERLETEVVDLKLNCSGLDNCNPLDAENLLKVENEEVGWYTEDKATWLVLNAQAHLVPEGEERNVQVTLRQSQGPVQELDISVLIRGPVCGNGVLEHRENCESQDDLQGMTCADFGYNSGDLKCDSCRISESECFNSCEDEDFNGLTCSYYGFENGELQCLNGKVSTDGCW